MKIISWNVAGYRAVLNKGFNDFMDRYKPDILCLQETKLFAEQLEWCHQDYCFFLNPAKRAGYSGTAFAARKMPKDLVFGFGEDDLSEEGRTITVEYPTFYLVTAYVPNSQDLLKRLSVRLKWESQMREFLLSLDAHKPVIYCGDLNVCHKNIDIANPHIHHHSPGFSDEEREAFQQLLDLGFVDVWRELHPEQKDSYSFWSYRGNARENNVGWRLDYFVVSKRLLSKVRGCDILQDVMGSDHCPILLDIHI